MRKLNENFFAAICLLFSTFLLVLFLFTSIDVTAEKDRCARLRREIQTISEENELLRARVEAQLSLPEIERRALALGMQPCAAGQIEVLKLID